MKDLNYFLSNTILVGECLEWSKAYNSEGYPRNTIKGNVNAKVHREVFFLVNGYYPPVVRHTCDNTRCINPKHLLGGTNIENVDDRHSRKRTRGYVDAEEIEKVHQLKDEGFYMREIADKLEIKFKRVEYILTQKTTGV